VLGKLQSTVRNADNFKYSTGTCAAAHVVKKRKRLSYAKTKYPGTDNNNIKTVMGPASFEEPPANLMEK